MRLLALDIGNTNVTAGLFEGETLRAQFRLRTDSRRTADEYAALIDSLLGLHADVALRSIQGVAIASVVPGVTAILETVCRTLISADPFIVMSSGTDTGLRIDYDPIASLGADRLVNAFAALHLYAPPSTDGRSPGCIVVDYGTATKLEAVDRDGVYRGGAILPGVRISLDALYERAALLRQIPLSPAPTTAIGRNTADALRSGILLGYGAQTDGLVARFRAELDAPNARVIATGGLADLVAPHAATVQITDTNLTVIGLRMLYERNRGK